MSDYQIFKSKVKGELKLRRWTYKDLSKACGYSNGSIRLFMSDRQPQRYNYSRVASAIATALNLEL